jgi:imidazole glycerol-phosphate synthase subunit HisH
VSPKVAIIDYGIGNLHSAQKALEHVGADARLSSSEAEIDAADAVVLPGVGAFGKCVTELKAHGLEAVTLRAAASGRPFLGVCVGFQMLFDASEENPETPGLAVFAGTVRRLTGDVKLPQMQWNQLSASSGGPLFAGLESGWVYFVHSFAPDVADVRPTTTSTESRVLATCQYPGRVVASTGRGTVMGTQFHPEKSGRDGLRLLSNFIAMAA